MQLELNNEAGKGERTLERLESVKASWEWKVFSWEGSISSDMRTPNDLATVHGGTDWGAGEGCVGAASSKYTKQAGNTKSPVLGSPKTYST